MSLHWATGFRCGLLLAVTLLPACGDGAPSRDTDGAATAAVTIERVGARQVHAAAWDTVFVIGGGVQDTMLLVPRLLAARGGQLYAFDYGDSRVKAFDAQGQPRWQFGGSGSGPEEFGNPLDMEVGPDGSVWVVDATEGRLSVVAPSGAGERLVRHPSLLVKDVVPLRDHLIATLASPGDTFWIALDSAGRARQAGRSLVPGLAEATPMIRQGFTTVADDGRAWATIFPFGNPFVVYDGTEVRCHGRLVEGEPFPRQRPDNGRDPVWAVASVLTDSSLFVLPRGQTDLKLRALDEYSARDCRYLRTVRLPQKAVAMAYSDGIFYFTMEDPAPFILAARLETP